MGKHSKPADSIVGALTANRAVNPTQVEHPWRAAVRTAFQIIPALALLIPLVLPAVGVSTAVGFGAAVVAVCLAVTRVMALPAVNDFIDRWLPWLRAA